MGLLDSLLQTATGALASGSSPTDVIHGLIQDHGGLGGLLGKLREAGLGSQVDSWVGTGQNLPVSAQSILAALGQGRIAEVARSLGVDPQQAAEHLAQLLPQAIDHLTPNGQLPAEGAIAAALQALKGRVTA